MNIRDHGNTGFLILVPLALILPEAAESLADVCGKGDLGSFPSASRWSLRLRVKRRLQGSLASAFLNWLGRSVNTFQLPSRPRQRSHDPIITPLFPSKLALLPTLCTPLRLLRYLSRLHHRSTLHRDMSNRTRDKTCDHIGHSRTIVHRSCVQSFPCGIVAGSVRRFPDGIVRSPARD